MTHMLRQKRNGTIPNAQLKLDREKKMKDKNPLKAMNTK